MSVESVRALVEAHLPETYEPLLLSFRAVHGQPKGRLIAIGDDFGTTLYCDLGDGRVLSVDDSGKLPTRFMNSGIPQLAHCLAEYEKARRESVQPSLRARLLAVDAAALAEPEHWWATIVEQIGNEQL